MSPSYGRILFGTSVALFAVVSLMWRGSEMWQHLHLVRFSSAGTIFAWCLAIAQVATGIGVLLPRTAGTASLLLSAIYAAFTVASIQGIIKAPTAFASYDGFFENCSLVCGALAVYAPTRPDAQGSATVGRVACIGLGFCALSFALAQLFYLQFTASLVPKWIPPNQMFWAILTTIGFALAAIAILLNRRTQLALRLTTLMLVLFAVLVWVPQVIAHPTLPNWSEFALTLLIAGAYANARSSYRPS